MAKQDYKQLLNELDRDKLPKHIGFIMDGNGRWAKKRNKPHLYGHRAGVKSLRQVVELGVELKLQYCLLCLFYRELEPSRK